MTCRNFAVTAMYENQFTEPFLIDLHLIKSKQIKFGHSEKATKFETISHLIRHLLSKRQIMWEIVSNFVAFSECPNFNKTDGKEFVFPSNVSEFLSRKKVSNLLTFSN